MAGMLAQPGRLRLVTVYESFIDAVPAGSGEVWRFDGDGDGVYWPGRLLGTRERAGTVLVEADSPLAWAPPAYPDLSDEVTRASLRLLVERAWAPLLLVTKWRPGHPGYWVFEVHRAHPDVDTAPLGRLWTERPGTELELLLRGLEVAPVEVVSLR